MDNSKNIFGVILLIVILLTFVVGGYFLMDYMVKMEDVKENLPVEDNKEYRKDNTKDYVYFTNEEEITHEILKRDVVLNFLGYENINNMLAKEVSELYANKELVGDRELPEGITCDEDIYESGIRDYTYTKFGKYISLVINDSTYNCVLGSKPIGVKSYVINKENGKELDYNSLLNEFNMTDEKIIELVKVRLNNTQVLEEGVQVIDIDGTIAGINNGSYNKDKALSVSKNGNLVINFIVKSNKINYNDSIELI